MRKPIFQAIRTARGKGFTGAEVAAVDALLDQLGVDEDEDDSAHPAGGHVARPPAAAAPGLDDPAAFYDSLRRSGLFPSALKPDQKEGLEAILTAARREGWPISFAAYALATAYHETARTMQPVREAFWLSETWRKNNLRYYPYYGRGYVQLTWLKNYQKADEALGLGGKLVSDLDRAMEPDVAASILGKGMTEGWFCRDASGPHSLARHCSANGPSTPEQFKSARRIINGTDKAAKVADEAMKFQTALQAGGW
jgi:putative chitinase